jgi:single-strand DNA-binding protein
MAGGGVNKVILIGNVGKDPELRYTPSGQPVCDLRLATNESWTDKQGQKQERTEWHSVVLWGKPAEIVKQYVTKGQRIYIEGRLQTRSWDDKTDGKKRYMTEIVANDFMFLSGRGEGGAPSGGGGGGGGGEWSGGGRSQGGAGGGGRPQQGGGNWGGGGGGSTGGGGFRDDPPADDYGGGGGAPPGDDDIPF